MKPCPSPKSPKPIGLWFDEPEWIRTPTPPSLAAPCTRTQTAPPQRAPKKRKETKPALVRMKRELRAINPKKMEVSSQNMLIRLDTYALSPVICLTCVSWI